MPLPGPYRVREVGGGRTTRQPGQVRKEAALTRPGGSLSSLPLARSQPRPDGSSVPAGGDRLPPRGMSRLGAQPATPSDLIFRRSGLTSREKFSSDRRSIGPKGGNCFWDQSDAQTERCDPAVIGACPGSVPLFRPDMLKSLGWRVVSSIRRFRLTGICASNDRNPETLLDATEDRFSRMSFAQ